MQAGGAFRATSGRSQPAANLRCIMGLPFDVVAFAGKDWDSHRQRPHWIADELAQRGAEVLFVENLGVRTPRVRDASRVVVKLNIRAPQRCTVSTVSARNVDGIFLSVEVAGIDYLSRKTSNGPNRRMQ